MRRFLLLAAIMRVAIQQAPCPIWCDNFKCDGSAWCRDGQIPMPCAPCAPASTSSTSAPPAMHGTTSASWEVYDAKNCWWGGHGAEEIGLGTGVAVPNVTSVDACKAACLSSNLHIPCDGVLLQLETKSCFLKATIVPALCSHDTGYTLYVRTDLNRPPSAPRSVVQSGLLTAAKCSAMVRDPNHKFWILWPYAGWGAVRHRGEPGDRACWDVDWSNDWFDFVGQASNCRQNWGNNLAAPTVFGFSESMAMFCSGGRTMEDPGGACSAAGLNILRIADWNMCRNAEWMVCVVKGQTDWSGQGTGEIIFTYAPSALNIDDFNSREGWYLENDIYCVRTASKPDTCG